MPRSTEGYRQLLGLSQVIGAATFARQGTAAIWSAVRSAAEAVGMQLRASVADLSALRGEWAAVRNAAEATTSATPDTGISSDMIAMFPGTVLSAAVSEAPEYYVRYQVSYRTPTGELSTAWLTNRYLGTLPSSVGSLMGDLYDAATIAADSGSPPDAVSVESVSSPQILLMGE
jgi:hypothetical protein